MKQGLIFFTMIMVSGCATISPNFMPVSTPPDNSSTVYIYYNCDKTSDTYLTGGLKGPEFRVNGKFIGYLAPDSYIPLVLPPSKVKMEFLPTWNYGQIPELVIDFEVESEGTKYLRYTYGGKNISYMLTEIQATVQEVDPNLAIEEIASCQINKASYQRALESGLSI